MPASGSDGFSRGNFIVHTSGPEGDDGEGEEDGDGVVVGAFAVCVSVVCRCSAFCFARSLASIRAKADIPEERRSSDSSTVRVVSVASDGAAVGGG